MYSHDSYLDPAAGPQKEIEKQLGLDAKFVIHDALTLDAALNPDFSEIGTDDPKVQVNQRFEVVFPERRPFFLENASIFVYARAALLLATDREPSVRREAHRIAGSMERRRAGQRRSRARTGAGARTGGTR